MQNTCFMYQVKERRMEYMFWILMALISITPKVLQR